MWFSASLRLGLPLLGRACCMAGLFSYPDSGGGPLWRGRRRGWGWGWGRRALFLPSWCFEQYKAYDEGDRILTYVPQPEDGRMLLLLGFSHAQVLLLICEQNWGEVGRSPSWRHAVSVQRHRFLVGVVATEVGMGCCGWDACCYPTTSLSADWISTVRLRRPERQTLPEYDRHRVKY